MLFKKKKKLKVALLIRKQLLIVNIIIKY